VSAIPTANTQTQKHREVRGQKSIFRYILKVTTLWKLGEIIGCVENKENVEGM
jgi:hypothetical protein